MQNFKEQVEQIKKDWFIATLLEIKGLEGINQKEFAQKMGVSDSFITRIKGGKATVPQSLIDKICKEFNILPPEINQNTTSMAQEPVEPYQNLPKPFSDLINSLKSNLSDLRREVSETYDHIADLKEFNEYLKSREASA